MQLYRNTDISDVDSFSTVSDGTKGQQQRNGEGWDKLADMGFKSTPFIGLGPSKVIHLGTHLSTHPDTQCVRSQESESLGPIV
jgi:hypothetical protein